MGDLPVRLVDEIDLLIGAHELEASVYALAHLGYEASAGAYDFRRDSRYPVLRKPGGAAGIALHTQPLDLGMRDLLTASDVRMRAARVHIDGREVSVASAEDQVIALVTRAMISRQGFKTNKIPLSDALAYLDLFVHHDVPIDLIYEHFAGVGYANECEAFVCFVGLVWGDLVSYPNWCSAGEDWAEKAFESLEVDPLGRHRFGANWKLILHDELRARTGIAQLFDTIRRAGPQPRLVQVPQVTRLAS